MDKAQLKKALKHYPAKEGWNPVKYWPRSGEVKELDRRSLEPSGKDGKLPKEAEGNVLKTAERLRLIHGLINPLYFFIVVCEASGDYEILDFRREDGKAYARSEALL